MKKNWWRSDRAGKRQLWLFLLPSAGLLGLVMLYPLTYAIYISFFNDDLGIGSHAFVGAANYLGLLGDPRFWISLAQTLLICVAAVTLEFFVGLAVAYSLYGLRFGVRTFNLLLFLPYVVTPVVAGLFLRWIFVGRWGLLSGILIGLGIFPPDWLGTAGWARLAVVLTDGWQFTPFIILVIYAGLNTVDQSQIEAARVDGAGGLAVLFRIMLPAIKPVILFVLLIRTMDAFRMFDIVYVLTAGGPGTATETITMYDYALAFHLLQIGKASALGVLILLILGGITAAMIAATYRRERGEF
jgi:multiple sugar transport system permease protein